MAIKLEEVCHNEAWLFLPPETRLQIRDKLVVADATTSLAYFSKSPSETVSNLQAFLKSDAPPAGIADWKNNLVADISNAGASGLKQHLYQVSTTGFPPDSDHLMFHWVVGSIVFPENPMRPKEGLRKYTRKRQTFASPYVAALLSVTMGKIEAMDVALYCMSSSGQLEEETKRGYWFEYLAHILLVVGGRFQCRLVSQKFDFELTLPPSTVEMFNSIENAADLVKTKFKTYCMQWAPNQVGLDALSSHVLYFQMATWKRHGVQRDGLPNPVKTLDTRKLEPYNHLMTAAAHYPY